MSLKEVLRDSAEARAHGVLQVTGVYTHACSLCERGGTGPTAGRASAKDQIDASLRLLGECPFYYHGAQMRTSQFPGLCVIG